MLETIRTFTDPQCSRRELVPEEVDITYAGMNMNYLLDEGKGQHVEAYTAQGVCCAGKYIIVGTFNGTIAGETLRVFNREDYSLVGETTIGVSEGNNPMFYDETEHLLYLNTPDPILRVYYFDETEGTIGELKETITCEYYSGITRVGDIWYGVKNGSKNTLYKDILGEVEELPLDVTDFDDTKASYHPFQSLTTDGDGNLVIARAYPNELTIVSTEGKALTVIPLGNSWNFRTIGELEGAYWSDSLGSYTLVGYYSIANEYDTAEHYTTHPDSLGRIRYKIFFELGPNVECIQPVEYYTQDGETQTATVGADRYIHVAPETCKRHTGDLKYPFNSLQSALYYAEKIESATDRSSCPVVVDEGYDTRDFSYNSECISDAKLMFQKDAHAGIVTIQESSEAQLKPYNFDESTGCSIEKLIVGRDAICSIDMPCPLIEASNYSTIYVQHTGATVLTLSSCTAYLYHGATKEGVAAAYSGTASYTLIVHPSNVDISAIDVSNAMGL